MAITSPKYGTPTTITCTLASLATGTGRQTVVVDNTADVAVDSIVHVKITNGTGTAGSIDVYAYGTADGTNYTGGAGTTDTIFTPTASQVLQLRKLDTLAGPPSGYLYSNMFSILAAFGTMPRKWGLVIVNNGTGASFNATAGNHSVQYSIVQYQTV